MNYQVTGNEYVSLPTIRESDGAIEGISCLFMRLKGMLEMKGQGKFIQPYIELDGKQMTVSPVWYREHFWIPSFVSNSNAFSFRCKYLTPIGERGFGLRLSVLNKDLVQHEFTIGVAGDWFRTFHTVNESICLDTGRIVKESSWNNMFVFQQVPGIPLMAFAPIVGDNQPFSEIDQGANWVRDGFSYSIYKTCTLQQNESFKLDIFFGVGYEEVAAATSALEMLRHGFDAMLHKTEKWLAAREKHVDLPKINEILNTNLFFCLFFSSGRTIDTEELCMVTSRSPRYYVSAAYWDRDSLLWAFPAILLADPAYAKELLISVFKKQGRNFGIHSRFIDGTVLEPGFELDELCAPVIALYRYVNHTNDYTILERVEIVDALESILPKLESRKHPEIELYSTFLQPTDDMHNYPYLTYNNVLVWKTFIILSKWFRNPQLVKKADNVKKAIEKYCVLIHEGKQIFAWSVDLLGNWDIYDEPPGSLQLLPYYGFCKLNDPVWVNTQDLIRDKRYPLSFAGHRIAEIGCKHAPHPWILSICNSLLSGYADDAIKHLMLTSMDNGIACESVHEDTGECTTGAAFATCAGFLAYSLYYAFEKGNENNIV